MIVGFALETGDALAKGLAKLERKGLDLIVVNDALEPGAGFEKETNRVAMLGRDGSRRILPLQSKREVADAILDVVEQTLGVGGQRPSQGSGQAVAGPQEQSLGR
jgi:phosphopantothenoylcysteine decarboxylase/phosphopantothenate--cysteine ligase